MNTSLNTIGEEDMQDSKLIRPSASADLERHLISVEIENNPNSSNDRMAANNYRQMRLLNRRMTIKANK